MSSVTARIKEIKQPWGGYIKPSQFSVKEINDGNVLSDVENVHATVVGLSVDYLTRYMMGTEIYDVFSISYEGAMLANVFGHENAVNEAQKYIENIKGLDDKSIINTCKLATFDVWVRNTIGAIWAKTADEINPDSSTIENIRIMVERSLSFWREYGPIVKAGFTFETTGYTQTVDSGDGDYLTSDTLWDFKVSKNKPTSKHTLQLLMYWIMVQHSGKTEFKEIKKIGFYNPRLNTVYILEIESIPQDIIEEVEKEVICYWDNIIFRWEKCNIVL